VRATISCSKYIDHSLEMSLKGGKKRVKRSVFIAGSTDRQVLTCISLSVAGLPTPFSCFP
jgi:hypothetical protein